MSDSAQAHAHAAPPVPTPAIFRGGGKLLGGGIGAFLVGAVLFVIGFVTNPRQALFSYLAAWTWAVSIALGALIFILIGNAMSAKWPVALRRVPESIAATLPLLGILFIPIALGMAHLYSWTSHAPTGDAHLDHLLHHKRPYLNVPFFIGRTVFYFVVWTVIITLLRRWSDAQDADPKLNLVPRAKVLSAVGLPVVGLTLAFASFDWLMSLTPAWFSTMWPVYYFAGGFLASIALITTLCARGRHDDALFGRLLSTSHFYALGRMCFAFIVFWAYISFFQGFIIYAANKPEEVTWYATRLHSSWQYVGLLLIVGHFALPFFGLISYPAKRSPRVLAAFGVWILAMHYVDIYWMALPTLHVEGVRPHWLDVAALLAVGGAALAFGVFSLRGKSIAPAGDPGFLTSVRYRSQ